MDPLTYSWIQTAGPAMTLTGANTATPTFTAPARAGHPHLPAGGRATTGTAVV